MTTAGPGQDPIGPDEPSAAEEEESSGIDAVLARLRERGLLVDRPVAPSAAPLPRPPAPAASAASGPPQDRQRPAPGDEWDVESQGGVLVAVRCPKCGIDQQWPGDVTRFRCRLCQRAWRWAVCERCGELGFPLENQEIWRCRSCGHFSRAWWRTSGAARDALVVVARRRQLVTAAYRQGAKAVRRRWILVAAVAAAVTALVAVAALALVGGSTAPAAGTDETCRQFERLRSDLGSGTLEAAALRERLEALQTASGGASPAVASAVAKLVSVGRPSEAAFLVAQTELADACAAATN